MPNDKHRPCRFCGEEKTLRGVRMHEIKCEKLHATGKQVIKSPEPASKPQEDKQPEIKVITAKEPENAPQVKIEAKELKPEKVRKVIKQDKMETAQETRVNKISKPAPVTRKPADLFDNPVEKQEAKPQESKKAEKENRERGLFSFHRDD